MFVGRTRPSDPARSSTASFGPQLLHHVLETSSPLLGSWTATGSSSTGCASPDTLRPRSLSFPPGGTDLLAQAPAATNISTREEVGLTLYGILGVLFTNRQPWSCRSSSGSASSEASSPACGDRGPVTRVLLIVLNRVRPPDRYYAQRSSSSARVVSRLVRQQRRLTVSACNAGWAPSKPASLLRDSGAFTELPLSALNDLAGRAET